MQENRQGENWALAQHKVIWDVHNLLLTQGQLSMLLEHRFSVPKIADMFGVSVSNICRRMSDYGVSVGATYTDLDDKELDRLVREIQDLCGNRQM